MYVCMNVSIYVSICVWMYASVCYKCVYMNNISTIHIFIIRCMYD